MAAASSTNQMPAVAAPLEQESVYDSDSSEESMSQKGYNPDGSFTREAWLFATNKDLKLQLKAVKSNNDNLTSENAELVAVNRELQDQAERFHARILELECSSRISRSMITSWYHVWSSCRMMSMSTSCWVPPQ